MADETIITNENIKNLVKLYITNKEGLPNDLVNKPIGDWDVSRVTSMLLLFSNYRNFNESLTNWDVSQVTNMGGMFSFCQSFNQSLNWNVSKVKNMNGVFDNCKSFNQPLNWDVSKVTTMNGMFKNCKSFNQPLNWDVSKVAAMKGLFQNCTNFNQPLNDWDVSKVTDMSLMFEKCTNFNKLLNDWNVSQVTDMYYMFSRCIHFNQPLNDWNVSQVTNMGNMFENCRDFNQPLNNWDVSNATFMRFMFENCVNFNQPLNNWNISPAANVNGIFLNCAIEEQNKPQRTRRVGVDSQQIHKESSKIKYDKLIVFLKEKTNINSLPTDINYPTYINDTLLSIINESDEPEDKKIEERDGLTRIMNERLQGLNYSELSATTREYIFYTLEYLKLQSVKFKNVYIDTFIKDCVYAYDSPNGMTCAAGALERIVYSLVPACQTLLTDMQNTDYETIIAIIIANPNKLIPEYIQDWYKLHKTGTQNEFKDETKEQIKKNLKDYLLEKFPNESNLIDENITKIADVIGYEKDDFMYGGKKRKYRKTKRKSKKTKKLEKYRTRNKRKTKQNPRKRTRTNIKKSKKI